MLNVHGIRMIFKMLDQYDVVFIKRSLNGNSVLMNRLNFSISKYYLRLNDAFNDGFRIGSR